MPRIAAPAGASHAAQSCEGARTDFRDFAGALRRSNGVALIAEIKKVRG